ncbi:MAG: CPXCG motif-containing cysteine-rich protein [Planctomycetota bacterium]
MDDDCSMRDEAEYICESCGEQIVIPIDWTAGEHQEYVEDCPVCCHPNLIHVEIDERGELDVSGTSEQDLH